MEQNWITYEKIKLNEPFFIFFSLIGVNGIKGYNKHPNLYGRGPISLDDDNLQSPEILIESLNSTNRVNAVNSIMTFLWNAFGFEKRA